jgi:hypothetical protein
MSGLLFVSQAMLDGWAEQGKIDFAGNVLTLLPGGGQGRSYRLRPAVRFLALLDAGVDHHALLSKVKTHAQLKELAAEVVGDSCLVGETAYEVEPGFLAEAAAVQAGERAKTEGSGGPRPFPPGEPLSRPGHVAGHAEARPAPARKHG